MEQTLEDFIEKLDFSNFDYFYHETSNAGDRIMEEGLLVDGNNILGVDNILFTTVLPFTEEIVANLEQFIKEEISYSNIRPVTEMVILEFDKGTLDTAVGKTEVFGYEGIVDPCYIKGVIDMENLTFKPNEQNCKHF